MSAGPEELFSNHTGLAEVISLEYANIPNALPSEIFAEAQQGLFRAAQGFDPARGEFGPYAARAIRNALNTLYAKQLRLAKVFPKSIDEPPQWAKLDPLESASDVAPTGSQDSKQDVFTEVRRRETGSIIEEVLTILSPRERIVVDWLKLGRSLRLLWLFPTSKGTRPQPSLLMATSPELPMGRPTIPRSSAAAGSRDPRT